MGPLNTVRTVSQEAFDEMVKENIEDLRIDPAEALEDAIETLTLQRVDLSGIVKCVPGESGVMDNPVIRCVDRLKQLDSDANNEILKDFGEVLELYEILIGLFCLEGSGNIAIAAKNGALELTCSLCSKFSSGPEQVIASALKTLSFLLCDVQSTEKFQNSRGPEIVMDILNSGSQNPNILNSGFSVVAAASTGNEIVKESFMGLKIDEHIFQIMERQPKGSIDTLYDAIRAILTPDDNRVVASQVYGYARRFAKVGIARALVDSLDEGLTSSSLVSACVALKTVVVNDEICKCIAESGGIDVVLKCIDDSGEQRNQTVAIACCSLLAKLAGSDANKSEIVEKGGLDLLMRLSTRFSDDPSVLQEVMSIIWVLCLRSPKNAAHAIEAGAGELAVQAMQKFPAAEAEQMQRSACLMIRNLVVRNPENRALLLSNGIERLIRKAKESHRSCKDAATDALRDLGLENYSS